ncbi:methylamine utilization protein [Colwellia echini]|uniref:Methylamine utilization protein n=1 Tax=Colwellia echini TaxID=1982103 RepID=A0ABY3MXH7_9GAMM|nr:methylamine utilization protein [Colwellia echini]TYK65908.1 methylamine utilization protein [Colwellia echini]
MKIPRDNPKRTTLITLVFKLIMTLAFCTLVLSNSAFSQTKIKVVDQNNSPLSNAIIEFVIDQPSVDKPHTGSTYVMDQVNKEFSPEVLIVPVNNLVSFPNSDDIRHHVYSFSPAKTFELKLYAGKPKSPIAFDNTGVVVMGCNIHDSMVGYIYVTDKQQSYMTDEQGEVVLTQNNIVLNTQLQVWHAGNSKGVDQHTIFTINQAMLKQDEITLMINVISPEPRDSFAELVVHEH